MSLDLIYKLMVKSMIRKKLMSFIMIFIILLYSGCVQKSDLDLNQNPEEIIVTSTNELEHILDNKNISFNQEFKGKIKSFERNNSGYNSKLARDTAYNISIKIEQFGLETLNKDTLRSYKNFKTEMIKINKIIKVLNENTDTELKKISISHLTHNKLVKLFDSGQKYIPILNSYNRFIHSSNEVINERLSPNKISKDCVKKFYMAAFLLGVDVCFVQSSAIHKTVFKSVGTINTKLKLMKTIPYLGHSGYGLLLSSIYWNLRGHAGKLKNDAYKTLLNEV
jgi:hypothetical protein